MKNRKIDLLVFDIVSWSCVTLMIGLVLFGLIFAEPSKRKEARDKEEYLDNRIKLLEYRVRHLKRRLDYEEQ